MSQNWPYEKIARFIVADQSTNTFFGCFKRHFTDNILSKWHLGKTIPKFHSVHWVINPFFSPSLPLNMQTIHQPPPLFRQFPLYVGFSWTPPRPKNWIFQWIPIILKFFILYNPISLFKRTFQFKFLVLTEKNFFVYWLFLLLNISDFSSFFM